MCCYEAAKQNEDYCQHLQDAGVQIKSKSVETLNGISCITVQLSRTAIVSVPNTDQL